MILLSRHCCLALLLIAAGLHTTKISSLAQTASEISIVGNRKEIISGDLTPDAADHTWFGAASPTGGSVSRRFTVKSIDATTLIMSAPASVSLSGANAGDFTVTHQPTAQILGKGSSTFQVLFTPKAQGLRQATVTVLSDDPDEGSYTFAIAGFGGLVTGFSQSIVFPAPATAYIPESPITLSAWATSGLPVSFTVVSGPATLSGQTLTLTSPGVVKVAASQAGGGNFKPAPTITKTIKVLAAPSTLTLSNLVQVYDGTPRTVTVYGPAAVITYQLGQVTGGTPPINPGTYKVTAAAGGITKTATLVVLKAPLHITPNDVTRYAGKPDPAFTLSYVGFRGSDDAANALTTLPKLSTKAKLSSPAGTYPILAGGAVSANYQPIYRPGTLTVRSFAAAYEAVLLDGVGTPLGKLNFNVVPQGTTFTGSLLLASEPKAVPIKGTVSTDSGAATANATGSVLYGGATYQLNTTLTEFGVYLVELNRNGDPFSVALARRLLALPRGRTVPYSGSHTLGIGRVNSDPAIAPGGSGWATVNINTQGVMSIVGKLADGTSVSSSVKPSTDADPVYQWFAQPYGRLGSFIASGMTLIPHPTLVNRRRVGSAIHNWVKVGKASDKTYPTGIAYSTGFMTLEPWQAPKAPTTLSALLGLSGSPGVMQVDHTYPGAPWPTNVATELNLSATNAITVTLPVGNPTGWKATIVPTKGTFTGSLNAISGSATQNVKFSGVLFQTISGEIIIGSGHYLYTPPASATPVSGEVQFTR